MNLLIFVIDYFEPSAMHFLFSGLAGCLGFSLTLTIFSAAYHIRRSNAPLTPDQKYFILGLALLVSFCMAWLAHYYLDIFTDWWTMPLGAPLTIIK